MATELSEFEFTRNAISRHMDPTIQTVTVLEVEWGSAVRHWRQILPNHNVSDVVNPGMASGASEFEFTQNSHETTTKAELSQYHHQSLSSPPVVTITNAIENDQLNSFPGLEKALLKHLLVSSATINRLELRVILVLYRNPVHT